MTAKELDAAAAEALACSGTEQARKRLARAAAFLKSRPEALSEFSDLAEALRDVGDMRRLLGAENEMFKELAEPAAKRGRDALRALAHRALASRGGDQGVVAGISEIAMAFARRGRKPEKAERKMKA